MGFTPPHPVEEGRLREWFQRNTDQLKTEEYTSEVKGGLAEHLNARGQGAYDGSQDNEKGSDRL